MEKQRKSSNSSIEEERNLPEKSSSMEEQSKSPNSSFEEQRNRPKKHNFLGIEKSPIEKEKFKERRNLRKKLLEKQRKSLSPNSSFEEESTSSTSESIMKKQSKSPKYFNISKTEFRQFSILPHSVIMEDPSESSNTENQSESDKKSSSISVSSSDVPDKTEQASSNREDCVSQPSQSDITEEQPKSTNVEKSKFDEKSLSPSISSHDVPETSIEQIPSNQEDFISQPLQSNITEEQPKSTNVKKNNEFDAKSSSPSVPSHDVPETSIEQVPSNPEDFISQPSQSDITKEQSKSTNVEKNNESDDEKSSSLAVPSHDVPETSMEQAPSNQEDFISQPSQSNITEEQSKSTNVEKNNESDDEKSSSSAVPSHDVPETSIEQVPSNQEDFISQLSQSDITEEQPKSTNMEKSNEFDEKSSSPAVSSHDVSETSIKQAPSNQEDFISKPSQSDITMKQAESRNIEENKSDENWLLSFTPMCEIPSVEQVSSNRDGVSSPCLSNITEESTESTNAERSNESDKKSSSSFILDDDVPETSIDQASLNQDFVSQSSQCDITEKQSESINNEDHESDEESLSSSISTNEFSPSEPFRDYAKRTTVMEKIDPYDKMNSPKLLTELSHMKLFSMVYISSPVDLSSVKPFDIKLSESDSDATVIKQSTSKSTLELKSPSSQGCIQENESDTKPIDNQYKKEEKHCSTIDNIKSSTELSSTEPFPEETIPKESSPKEPSPTEPSPTEPSPTEPSSMELFSTKLFPTKSSPTEPSRMESSPTESPSTEPSSSELSPVASSSTKPSPTKPSSMKSSFKKPSSTKPSPKSSPRKQFFTKLSPTESSPTAHSFMKPFTTEPSSTEPSPTKSSPTKPSLMEPSLMEPSPTEQSPMGPSSMELFFAQLSLMKSSPTKPSLTEPSLMGPSPTESSPIGPSPTEPSPTKLSLTEPSPTEPSPTEPSSTEPSPTEPSSTEPFPTKLSPTKPSLTEPSPIEPSPTEPSRMGSSPTESFPIGPSPTESSSTKPSPTEPSPTEPSPTEPFSTEPSSTEPSPTEPSPTEPSPTEPSPTELFSTKSFPTKSSLTKSSPIKSSPTEPSRMEPSPTELFSTKSFPTKSSPTKSSPIKSSPTEPSHMEPSSTKPSLTESSPTEPSPTEPSSTEPFSTEPSPTEPSPIEPSPTESSPTEPSCMGSSPTESCPIGPSPTESSPTEPSFTEPLLMELFDSDSDATVIVQPTSKFALELPLFLQECIQTNERDTKSTDNLYKKEEKHRSIIEKFPTESSSTRPEKSKDLKENVHDNISDSPASESADNQAETTSDREEDAMDPTTSMIQNNNQSLQTTSDIVKGISSKSKTTDKTEKDDEPEDDPKSDSKIKKGTKCSSKCCLVLLIISLIISLPLFIFILYDLGFLNFYQNKHTDILQTAVVELEKIIYDEDDTVRILNKHLDQDTSLIKVIALIGDSIIDKSYTVDIIRKKLRRKRRNGSLPWFPDFVVMENLREEHSLTVVDYAETFQEVYNDRPFTILAVYKIEEMNDNLKRRLELNQIIRGVNDTFMKADINFKIISYKLLTDTILDQYIINMEEKLRQTFSPDQIYNIKQSLIEDRSHCQEKYNCNKDQ